MTGPQPKCRRRAAGPSLALLAGLVACSAPPVDGVPAGSAPAQTAGAQYQVRLTVDSREGVVLGNASLSGLEGPVTFAFAERYAFAQVAPRFMDGGPGLWFTDPGGTPLKAERVDEFRWRLDPGESRACELYWTLRVDHRDQESVRLSADGFEQPYLAEDHGLLVTGALMPVPDLASSPRAEIEIVPPRGWNVIAPWNEVRPGVYAPDEAGLHNDLVGIGTWQRVEGQVAGLEYTLAFAPGQEPLARLVGSTLPDIIEAEVALFGGAPQPRYVFYFVAPGEAEGYGGSPKGNAMALFVTADLPPDFVEEGVVHLVAHEYHHTWMKSRCQPVDELRFVIEGFTDYYAYRVPWKLGQLSDESFLDALGSSLGKGELALERYGRSLMEAGGPAFFAGGDAYSACYSAGLALALWTDLALRNRGDNLDAFMRRFYGDPQFDGGIRPSLEDWLARLESDLGPEIAHLQADAVRRQGGIDWAALFAKVDLILDRTEVGPGQSPRANFEGTTITALDPSGGGALAGLRVGDELVEVNGRAVENEGEVRAAWGELLDGDLLLSFRRDGVHAERNGPAPRSPEYRLPAGILDRLR